MKYRYFDKDGNYLFFNLPNDGIYTIPKSYLIDDNRNIGFIVNDYKNSKGIIITQLPSAYEGALVFDGIDDYGICTGLPILDDYTVICRRIILTKPYFYYAVASKSKVANEGAFVFEIIQDQIYNYCHSFGANNRIDLHNGEISWQTKNSYNGNTINAGDRKDSDHLFIGRLRDTTRGFVLQGVIYYFALYNKSLTPEEIETEKERLNEEWLKRTKVTIPEPDVYYDLSLKDNSSPTRNIIDDLSGNGRDAEIFNAAYTESSGYRADGAFVFDGIDDYAVMQDEKKGFKTLFMEVVPFNLNKMIYDQRDTTNNFAIFNEPNSVAYNARNNGVTYINGKLNQTIISNNLIDKRQIITIVNGNAGNATRNITIGASPLHNEHFSNMALYKLIGFYDELTPLQIEKVINDYKLKHD